MYYEELLRRLRPNGLIMVDNTLWSGAIIDDSVDDESTVALRAFNDMVAADDRVDAAILHARRRPHAAAQALTPSDSAPTSWSSDARC